MLEVTEDARPEIDMLHVPITALGQRSRELLWALLDPIKVITSSTGHPRDWRGLAALARIPGQYTSSIHNSTDCAPTEKVLRLWSQQNSSTATIGTLQEFLQTLDRRDIFDDTFEQFSEDARLYWKQQSKPVPVSPSPHADHITFDDVTLYESGSTQVQRYHAYVLYAKEDFVFAEKLIRELKSRGYRICSEKDLLIGFTTVIGPVTRLINERCEHIIVIYSPDFLESAAQKFYMDYTQALGIKTNTRKLVPCMYRKCSLPLNYSFYNILYYNEERDEVGTIFNFWDKLSMSLLVESRLPRTQSKDFSSYESSNRDSGHPTCSTAVILGSVPLSTHAAAPSRSESLQLPSIPADLDSLTLL